MADLFFGQLNFGGAVPNALNDVFLAGSESLPLKCLGRSFIILHVEYEDAIVVASLTVDLIGNNAQPARNPSYDRCPANKGRSVGALKSGYFLGETVIIPVMGAKEFIVVNEIDISKKVCVWAVAI